MRHCQPHSPVVIGLLFAALLCAFGTPFSVHAQQAAAGLPVEVTPNVPSDADSVALTADERLLASGQHDGTIKLVDMPTGRLLRTLQRHSKDVTSVRFMDGGKHLLSVSDDMTIKLWEVETGKLIRTTELKTSMQYFWSIKLSPDGTRAVTSTTAQGQFFAQVKLWDVATGKLLQTFKANALRAIFSPDGTRILAGGGGMNYKPGGQVTLWDVASGRQLRTFEGHQAFSSVWYVAYSPDGQHIASGGALDNTVRLWDVATGRTLHTLAHEKQISLLMFSPDGARLLTSDQDGVVREWSVASGQLLRSFSVRGGVSMMSFMRDGNRALTRSYDGLQIFDVAAAKPLHTFTGTFFFVYGAVYSQDGNSIVSPGASTRRWDASTGQLVSETRLSDDEKTYVASYRPDINRILWSKQDTNALTLRDISSGRVLATFEHPKRIEHPALSPDGTRLLSALDNTMLLWDATTGKVLRTFAHPNVGPKGFQSPDSVDSVAFSPDGKRVLSGTSSGIVNLWDSVTGQKLWTYKEGPASAIVWSLEFSRDGSRIMVAVSDLSPKLLDAATGRLVRAFNGHASGFLVTNATFSADGTRMMSSSHDLTTKVWDVATGRLLHSLETGTVQEPAFSPDGKRALLNGIVWNLETGEHLLTMLSSKDEWLSITPEGYFTASANGAAALSAVRGLELWSIEQFYQSLYRPDLMREKLAGDPRGLVRTAAAQLDLTKVLASGGAPTVRIVSPAGDTTAANAQITAEVELAAQAGGVGRVEWRLNGLTVGVDNPATPPAGQTLRLARPLALDAGRNAIEVVAYNSANLIASVPAQVTVAGPVPAIGTGPAAPARAPRLFVLAAGADDYADARFRLQYSVPDATAMTQAFRDAGNGVYRSVEVKLLSNTEVTRDRLDGAFADLAKTVEPNDVFVFYLAGHGKTVDGRYYFVPQNFKVDGELNNASINAAVAQQGIAQDQWQRWFAQVPARKSLILFDTCESGTIANDESETKLLERGAANERLAQATGRSIITASSGSTEAFEGYHGHGLFTYNLLDAIDRGDGDSNGTIEVTELAAYAYAQVTAISERLYKQRQEPQIKITLNYSLIRQANVLNDSAPAVAANDKPTVQLIQTAQLQIKPINGATVVRSLAPKTAVTILRSEGDWTLIAQEGKPLGYVATRDLAPMH